MTSASFARVTLDAALSVGLRWLYATEQPTDALVEPGGATAANSAGRRAVMVVPTFCEMAIADTRLQAQPESFRQAYTEDRKSVV